MSDVPAGGPRPPGRRPSRGPAGRRRPPPAGRPGRDGPGGRGSCVAGGPGTRSATPWASASRRRTRSSEAEAWHDDSRPRRARACGRLSGRRGVTGTTGSAPTTCSSGCWTTPVRSRGRASARPAAARAAVDQLDAAAMLPRRCLAPEGVDLPAVRPTRAPHADCGRPRRPRPGAWPARPPRLPRDRGATPAARRSRVRPRTPPGACWRRCGVAAGPSEPACGRLPDRPGLLGGSPGPARGNPGDLRPRPCLGWRHPLMNEEIL